MKVQFSIIGCIVTALCLLGCCEEENNIMGIVISPNTVPAMEVGQTTQLTATITPTDATEELIWVSWDDEMIEIESNGAQATIKALKPGTTRIFATNRSKIVVSQEVEITVNSDDYASFIVGTYIGSGAMTGVMSGSLSGIGIKIEPVGAELSTVKMTLVANIPGLGEQTIIAQEVKLSLGAPGTYNLNGSANLAGVGAFTITGTFGVEAKALTLKLASSVVTIDVNAVPGALRDYGQILEDAYIGKANVTGAMNFSNLDTKIDITRISNTKVFMRISANSPVGMLVMECKNGQEISVAEGSSANICTLDGLASLDMMGMVITMKISGTFNMESHALTLRVVDNDLNGGLATINISAQSDSFDPTNYAKAVAGNYVGQGALEGFSATPVPIPNIEVKLERVDNTIAKMTVKADMTALGFGVLQPVGNMTVTAAYEVSGKLESSLFNFNVTGSVDTTNKKITLKLVVDGMPTVFINMTANMVEN